MVLSRQHLQSLTFFQRLTPVDGKSRVLPALCEGALFTDPSLLLLLVPPFLLLGDLLDRAHINRMLGIPLSRDSISQRV